MTTIFTLNAPIAQFSRQIEDHDIILTMELETDSDRVYYFQQKASKKKVPFIEQTNGNITILLFASVSEKQFMPVKKLLDSIGATEGEPPKEEGDDS